MLRVILYFQKFHFHAPLINTKFCVVCDALYSVEGMRMSEAFAATFLSDKLLDISGDPVIFIETE